LEIDKHSSDDALAVQVAVLKYKLDYSQRMIAERLNMSTMTVSRILERARKLGIVEINILTPIENHWNLEQQIENSFGIKKAVVFRNRYEEMPDDLLGRAAAQYIDYLLGPNDNIGISPGRTLAKVIPHLKLSMLKKNNSLNVIQTIGGFSTAESFSPVSILQEFVNNNNGVKGHFLNLPIYAPTVEVHNTLIANGALDSITRLWEKIDVMLFSIGPVGDDSIYRISEMLTSAEMNDLISEGAVGSVYGRWYDHKGHFLDSEINQRVFGIPIEIVKKIPMRILITSGKNRIETIKAGLLTQLCDIIITEENTARALLNIS